MERLPTIYWLSPDRQIESTKFLLFLSSVLWFKILTWCVGFIQRYLHFLTQKLSEQRSSIDDVITCSGNVELNEFFKFNFT